MKKLWIVIIISFCYLPFSLAQTKEEADSLHNLGRDLLSPETVSKSRQYILKAMEMRKTLFGEVNEDYINSLNNYALSFSMEEKYARAVELQEKVLSLCKKLLSPHPKIGMFTLNMGRYYYLDGKTDDAVKFWEEALPLVDKYGEMYEFLLTNLEFIYSKRSDNKNKKRIMALIDDHNKHELTKDCNDPDCMIERAQYYAVIGEISKAKETFLSVFSMKMEASQKVTANVSYAEFCVKINDYESASDYYESASNIVKQHTGSDETYANYIYKAAVYRFLGKQYQKAIDSYSKALESFSKFESAEALNNVADCWEGSGNAYSGLSDYGQAKTCFLKALSIYEQLDNKSEEYAKMLVNVATAEKFNKEYDASIEHYKQAMALFEEKGMVQDCANTAALLNLCCVYAGKPVEVKIDKEKYNASQYEKLDKIISVELSDLDLTKKYLGQLAYAGSLGTLAGCYALKKEYSDALEYYKKYMENIREAIRDLFRMQNETERMNIWNDELHNIQTLQEMMVTLPVGKESLMGELTALVYDAALLSKGILLNSTIEFENMLEERGDIKMKELYDKTKKNNETIEKLRAGASTEEDLSKLLELMRQNQNLQMQLYKGCVEYADFTDYISYDWKDVRSALKKTDVAVEFVCINNGLNDYMAALVLTSEMQNPIAMPICSLEEARYFEKNDSIFYLEGNPVWGQLKGYLSGKSRLFFSADNVFNNIGIEYLKFDGKPLSEQLEVYRLSSTKELCKNRKSKNAYNVALFGDINYNEPGTVIPLSNNMFVDNNIEASDFGAFANLDNTLREVNEIETVLKQHKINNVTKLTDVKASKSAFLNLTNKGTNMLHIATHGSFLNEKNTSDLTSMNYSILAFAGANLDNVGIVTAAEVSKLNLRQCDLVVLSACETGLGKLGEDGVFGLQRGFKSAGVNSLLMSVKNVYDETTADMMIGFYTNLLSGQSKREALVNAQKTIRDKGYSNPKYWATFILLDSLW